MTEEEHGHWERQGHEERRHLAHRETREEGEDLP